MGRRAASCVACAVALAVSPCLAFGPKGHRTVGAIADQKLDGTPTASKVATLLEGLSLEQAALLPDTIKSADAHPDTFVLPGHPGITTQLRAYLNANPHSSSTLDHHARHFVDVPVEGMSTFASGAVGRTDIDIVHTIPLCIGVLKGTVSENNPRKITKPIALILLAHLVADIHQPLHVGAEYFDDHEHTMNPDTQTGSPNSDRGGNTLTLHLREARE